MILTSSVFGEEAYGTCLQTFKKRLQLSDGQEATRGDLRFLVNVTMCPWTSDGPFMNNLVSSFRHVAMEEIKRCKIRNEIKPGLHTFVMQGLDNIFLVHLPMFHMASHRWQLIITADFPPNVHARYKALRAQHPAKLYTMSNANLAHLDDMVKPDSDLDWRMMEGIPGKPGAQLIMTFRLSNIHVVVKESLSFGALHSYYPDRMPFYLYGSQNELHLDHILTIPPNIQIAADRVQAELTPPLSEKQLRNGVVAVFEDMFERSFQPL